MQTHTDEVVKTISNSMLRSGCCRYYVPSRNYAKVFSVTYDPNSEITQIATFPGSNKLILTIFSLKYMLFLYYLAIFLKMKCINKGENIDAISSIYFLWFIYRFCSWFKLFLLCIY